jgi:tetratricopeptide (TPR) repeat protein
MGGPQDRFDFFISYTAADRAWAEWIAWQLEAARYNTVLQAWDFAPGENFVVRMRDALEQADRTIALLSEAYLASRYSTDEWTGAFLHDESGQERLLPVRVEACAPPRLLAARIYIDLAGVSRPIAKQRLLEGVKRGRRRPDREPPGPWGTTGRALRREQGEPRFPAQGPSITNLARRNLNFTGRTRLLEGLHRTLESSAGSAVTQAEATEAISGLGGIGKTQLVLEYAHRYASDYDLIWWIGAEQPTTVIAGLAELAGRLGIAERPDQGEMVEALWEELRGRDRWLLVFDNAEQPEQLQPYLPPGGRGHVLVTSRWAAWGEWARPLHLGVLAREEAVAFLCTRTGTQDEQAAGAVAGALGDLPLALADAAAYIERTQVGLDRYLQLVQARAVELFGLRHPTGAQRRVATVWSLSLERVREQAPGAEALLELCAFLAPEDIPRTLPGEHTEVLPEGLQELAADELAYNDALGVLGDYSLATVTPTTLGLHRLVQAVIRARLDGREAQWAKVAVELLDAAFPNDSEDLSSWPICERLLPHVLAATAHADRLDGTNERVGGLLDRASRYLWRRGLYQQAGPIAEQALTATVAAHGSGHQEVADRHDKLGQVLLALGDLESAKQEHEQALMIGEATLGPDHPIMATLHGNLGRVLRARGDLPGARTELERALEIGQATLAHNDPTLASLHSYLGLVLRSRKDLTGAHTELERALDIGLAAHGPDHPEVAKLHSYLGRVLRALGELERARTQHERALAIGEVTIGPDHPDMGHFHNNLGRVLHSLKDYTGAQAEYERALAIGEMTVGPDHYDMAARHKNLGKALRRLGDLPGAQAEYQRAVTIGKATNHPKLARWHRRLGNVLRELGDLPGAHAEYERALGIDEASFGPGHPK